MVLNFSSKSPEQEASNLPADSTSPQQGGAYPFFTPPPGADGQFPPFGPFARRGWGGHFRGMGYGHYRPEMVALEGGEHARGSHHHHHGPPPPPGHAPPFWGAPPSPPSHPDPPLPPMPQVAPEPPSYGSGMMEPGLVNLLSQHARNFGGDLAAHFGVVPPADGSSPYPGHNPRDFGGWRGRGGRGGRGGWGARGGWRRFMAHAPPGEFVHPRMDIYHSETIYTVTVELPGLQKQSVDISINEGLLTISGEFPSNAAPSTVADDPFDEYDVMDAEGEEVTMEASNVEREEQNSGFILHERPSGKFKRSLRLPVWVNLDAIKATMADGVLTLVFEKPQPTSSASTVHKVSIA